MVSPAALLQSFSSLSAVARSKLRRPSRAATAAATAPEPRAPRTLRQRAVKIARDAAILDLACCAVMLAAALLFADPQAGLPHVLVRFDQSKTAHQLQGLGETAHIAPHIDAEIAPFAERSPYGPLPRIAPDGRIPARAFARAGVASGGRPIISIIVSGLGLDEPATRAAIAKLPPNVTLAFSPYAETLPAMTDLARVRGQEYLLEVPVEPFDYPESDPGPLVLLADAAPIANIERLHHTLARGIGYVGVMTSGAARFATVEGAIAPVAAELALRGLALVDDGKAPVSKTPRIARQSGAISGFVDRRLDARPTDEGLALALLDLERLAVEQGHAIGATELYPVVIARLPEWIASLAAKGLVLEPVSVQILPSVAAPAKSEAKSHPS